MILTEFNYCSSSISNIVSSEVIGTTFTDKEKTIRTVIPDGAITRTDLSDEVNIYSFEWQEKKSITSYIEIRFQPLLKARDHLSPDYETHFQKKCKCIIIKRGWILIANQKGREFQYTIDKQFGIDRFFQWKDQRIQIHGVAPTEHQTVLKQRLGIIQQNLQLL
ncbi:MAG: hypothetical protein H3C43_07260 [Leptonema sp. (in: Bacteria)]|nr:hypothetical protein [Leptonema sp. (in: bacteria)]